MRWVILAVMVGALVACSPASTASADPSAAGFVHVRLAEAPEVAPPTIELVDEVGGTVAVEVDQEGQPVEPQQSVASGPYSVRVDGNTCSDEFLVEPGLETNVVITVSGDACSVQTEG